MHISTLKFNRLSTNKETTIYINKPRWHVYTQFSHNHASVSRQRNRIQEITNGLGEWETRADVIPSIFVDYLSELFKSGGSKLCEVIFLWG